MLRFVSLLTDINSNMIHSLLPLFLVFTTHRASVLVAAVSGRGNLYDWRVSLVAATMLQLHLG